MTAELFIRAIGIHFTRVLSVVTEGQIKVDRLEVLDQTPVIDIKPVRIGV